MGSQRGQGSSDEPSVLPDDPSPQTDGPQRFHGLAKACGWSLLLLAAAFIVWVASGVPPAFIGLWPRLAALAWLLVGMAGVVVAVGGHRRARAAPPATGEASWPVWTPPWVPAVSALVAVGAMVVLSFVVDGALPALVLGAQPGRSVAESADLREASGRREVDRTRVWFETSSGVRVKAWAADPDYVLGPGTKVVFDPQNPQRVMPESTWEKERSSPWKLPLLLVLWLGVIAAPFVIRRSRSAWYGTLQPGLHIVAAKRVRRTKLVRLDWDDGSSATFVDIPGFREAVERRLHEDGDEVALPWEPAEG